DDGRTAGGRNVEMIGDDVDPLLRSRGWNPGPDDAVEELMRRIERAADPQHRYGADVRRVQGHRDRTVGREIRDERCGLRPHRGCSRAAVEIHEGETVVATAGCDHGARL